MPGRRLATYVHVGGHVFGPDDEVPDWAAARMGVHVWREVPEDEQVPASQDVRFVPVDGLPAAGGDVPAVDGVAIADAPAVTGGVPADAGSPGPMQAPPRGGPGSGRDAWATYADSLGVTYGVEATRDDIVAAVDAAQGPQQ